MRRNSERTVDAWFTPTLGKRASAVDIEWRQPVQG
jgi:hypothetical protein